MSAGRLAKAGFPDSGLCGRSERKGWIRLEVFEALHIAYTKRIRFPLGQEPKVLTSISEECDALRGRHLSP